MMAPMRPAELAPEAAASGHEVVGTATDTWVTGALVDAVALGGAIVVLVGPEAWVMVGLAD
jgi:hypothetical protein